MRRPCVTMPPLQARQRTRNSSAEPKKPPGSGFSEASSGQASPKTAWYTAALVAASSSGELPVSIVGVESE